MKKFSFKICILSEFCQFVQCWTWIVVEVVVRLVAHISTNFNNDNDDNYKWMILFAWASLSYYIWKWVSWTERVQAAAQKLNHGRTHKVYTIHSKHIIRIEIAHTGEFSWLKADSNIQMTIIAHTKHTRTTATAHCTNVWIFSASYLSLIVVVVVIQCM